MKDAAPTAPGFDAEEIIPTLDNLFASLARRMLPRRRDDDAVADAMQIMRIAVWKASDRFDPSRGSVTTFAFTVARNALVDHLRGTANEPRIAQLNSIQKMAAVDESDDADVEQMADEILIEPARFLPQGEADIVSALNRYANREEARDALNLTDNAFRSALKRARRRVAQLATA